MENDYYLINIYIFFLSISVGCLLGQTYMYTHIYKTKAKIPKFEKTKGQMLFIK